jgi:hypothetical protein
MKRIIYLISLIIFSFSNLLHAQLYPKNYAYNQFYLGMPESEFLKSCEGIDMEILKNENTSILSSSFEPDDYNINVTDYWFIDNTNYFPKTDLRFDHLHFKFVNNLLFSFSMAHTDPKISKSKLKKLIEAMDKLYTTKSKKVYHYPANPKNGIYSGSRSYVSQVIGEKMSREGQRVHLTYRLKPNSLNSYGTIIYFDNYKQGLYWKAFVDMQKEYTQKGLIPFCIVDTIPLGINKDLLLSKNQSTFHLADSTKIAYVFRDNQYRDVYLKHDVYYSSRTKTFLDIPVKETDLFFYKNSLRMIRLMLTPDVNTDNILSILRKNYGRESKSPTGSYYWNYVYNDDFNETITQEFHLEFWPNKTKDAVPYLFFYDKTGFESLE